MTLILIGFCVRADKAGVSSFVRSLNFGDRGYKAFLRVFHSSGVNLTKLTSCWTRLCCTLFKPLEVGSRYVFLADGLKIPKEGKQMPAVKKLHQESGNNSKPEFIYGHLFQAVAIVVSSVFGQVAAIPLTSRIHEGIVRSNRNKKTLLDRLAELIFPLANDLEKKVIVVADAYYASGKLMKLLLEHGHHLLTRGKKNCVAFEPILKTTPSGRGRPKIYGKKVRLGDLCDKKFFTEAQSPVYGETNVTVLYRVCDLMWKPVADIVRFVIVIHPTRGTIFLLSTDRTLEPMDILRLYGYRFKIESSFRQAIHVLGTYAYHFWMRDMKPIKGVGTQYLHRESPDYRESVLHKWNTYHIYVQLGCIAQGLLKYLAINYSDQVWNYFRGWMRTINTKRPPSELVVSSVLRCSLVKECFLLSHIMIPGLSKVIRSHYRTDGPDIDEISYLHE
jgi:hypothetical protein